MEEEVDEVWGVRYVVWGVRCEVCGLGYEIWGLGYGGVLMPDRR